MCRYFMFDASPAAVVVHFLQQHIVCSKRPMALEAGLALLLQVFLHGSSGY